MERTFSISIIALSLAPFALCGTNSPAQQTPVEASGKIVLPRGTKIDPSKEYTIRLTLDGKQIVGSFTPTDISPGVAPPPVPSPSNQAPVPVGPTPARRSWAWLWITIGVLAAVAFASGGFWFYFRRYLPRKELEPYWNALRAIRARNYEAALPALTAVESKLPPDLRKNARFFIALCHFFLENDVEAEQMLAAQHRERLEDECVAYLLAYIRVRHGLDAEADLVFETMRKNGQEGLRDTRRLVGIVKFRRAMAALRGGDLDTAANLFEEVRKLGDFAAFIPGDLRNRHISLGVRALFDQDVATARGHFEAVGEAARALPEAERGPVMAKASLGLALARWIDAGPAKAMEVEEDLAKTLLLLHPDGPSELPWPEAEPGAAKGSAESLRRALEQADKNVNLPADEKQLRRCLRDVHLLRALAVLRFWKGMEGDAANKAIPEKLRQVLSRLACSRALDERFGDVYLVAGLLMFYLHEPGPERLIGADILAEARKLGVRDPYVLEIVNNRELVERENADAVDKYQLLIDRYLRNETVLVEVRRDLLNRLATHRRLMNRYKPPDLSRARAVPPTLQEIVERTLALRRKIIEIPVAKQSPKLEARSQELIMQSEELKNQAARIQQTESDLLALTGEQLFPDE